MLMKKDFADCIYNVLTPRDLHEKMIPLVTGGKCPGVVINYGNGHFLIGHNQFQDGLSISSDPFGMWQITQLSLAEDGTYQFMEPVIRTENTETVIRAIASLMIRWQENA
jgi:hypothetical protein